MLRIGSIDSPGLQFNCVQQPRSTNFRRLISSFLTAVHALAAYSEEHDIVDTTLQQLSNILLDFRFHRLQARAEHRYMHIVQFWTLRNLEKGKGDEGEVQSTTPLFGMTAKLQLQGGLQALEIPLDIFARSEDC